MVVLNKIYTRTGDDGTTALGSGERRKKYDLRVAAYGTIDEANAAIGVARLHTGSRCRARCRAGAHPERSVRRRRRSVHAGQGQRARRRAAHGDRQAGRHGSKPRSIASTPALQPLRSFVLPGGSAASAHLHLARTICRRAERLIAELKDKPDESVSSEVLKYVNRLSDFLFVASRYANSRGAGDVLWKPGENR